MGFRDGFGDVRGRDLLRAGDIQTSECLDSGSEKLDSFDSPLEHPEQFRESCSKSMAR